MRTAGRVFVLTGPSGVGKTTIALELLKRVPNLTRLVTYTTRAERKGEVEGRDYHFLSKAVFEEKVRSGDFFEFAEVYKELYGNSKHDLDALIAQDKDVLMVLDIQGAKSVQEKLPGVTSIFLQAESAEVLMRRLRLRGKMKKEDEARRAAQAAKEMSESESCTRVVTATEGEIEETVLAVLKIIRG